MFFIRKLGIDLGTANVLVNVPKKGIVLNEPSVVAVSLPENKILAVGIEAKAMIGRTPENIIAYRPIKDGVIADYRITEAMLRYLINKALGFSNIFKPEVIISSPAGITSTEKRSVIEAAYRAGAKAAYVVKEPILAAIGAGIPIQEPIGRMIVDIGGGTVDVAVISLGGVVLSASAKVAGNKIDQAISDYIKRNYNLAIGDRTAEEVKINIGSAVPLTSQAELKCEIKGRDILTGLPRSIEISTNEIARAINSELKEITKTIKGVLRETPPELISDIIDKGITMTGGTSLLKNLNEMILRTTGVKAYLADDPLLCVAKGTGIALEHLDVYKRSIISKR